MSVTERSGATRAPVLLIGVIYAIVIAFCFAAGALVGQLLL
jgi:hypothetical protein